MFIVNTNSPNANLGRIARMITDPNIHFDRNMAESINKLFHDRIESMSIRQNSDLKWAACDALIKHTPWRALHRFISAAHNWNRDGEFTSSDWRLLCTAANNYTVHNGVGNYVHKKLAAYCHCCLEIANTRIQTRDKQHAYKPLRKELLKFRSALQQLKRTDIHENAIQKDIDRLTNLLRLMDSGQPLSRTFIQTLLMISLDIDPAQVPQNDMAQYGLQQLLKEIHTTTPSNNPLVVQAYGELQGILCGELPITEHSIHVIRRLKMSLKNAPTDATEAYGLIFSKVQLQECLWQLFLYTLLRPRMPMAYDLAKELFDPQFEHQISIWLEDYTHRHIAQLCTTYEREIAQISALNHNWHTITQEISDQNSSFQRFIHACIDRLQYPESIDASHSLDLNPLDSSELWRALSLTLNSDMDNIFTIYKESIIHKKLQEIKTQCERATSKAELLSCEQDLSFILSCARKHHKIASKLDTEVVRYFIMQDIHDCYSIINWKMQHIY